MSGILYQDKELQDILSQIPLPAKKKLPNRVKKKKIIVIAGPTSVGKSAIGIKIAEILGGEIISADSMQVYRGMDIGTAKVSVEERQVVPHHLIDIRDLNENFNVVDFYNEAHVAVREIIYKDHVPMVVGGTGFYIHSLLYGPPTGPPSSPDVRERLENQMKILGPQTLYEKLKELDPDYAATITGRDRHKIIRALEIISLTNQKVSQFSRITPDSEDIYDFRCWFLYMPKEILYPRIEKRCDEMIQKGFLNEVRELEQKGLKDNLSACQAIGYRQALDFLQTDQSEAEMKKFIEAFKQASRRYAKRQFTWFRKEPLFRWVNIAEKPIDTVMEYIIQDYELS